MSLTFRGFDIHKCSRRDLAAFLPALAAFNAAAQERPAQQPPAQRAPLPPPEVLGAKIYNFSWQTGWTDHIETGRMKQHSFFRGKTTRGYLIDLHVSELAPDKFPHLPHGHPNEEITMIVEGSLEVEINGKVGEFGHGETYKAEPGSVIYLASNTVHGWHNIGGTPARYFDIALGSHTGEY